MNDIVARRTNEANRDVPEREPCTRVSDADIDTCDNLQIRLRVSILTFLLRITIFTNK